MPHFDISTILINHHVLWREMIVYILLSIIMSHMVESTEGAVGPAAAGVVEARPTLPPRKIWKTLTGARTEVVAKGGYSGLLPDSSQPAYELSVGSSVVGTILYCNVHFTKDTDGFCIPRINLGNVTNIEEKDPQGRKTYDIYGTKVDGWFGFDYPSQFIFENVATLQNIFTRPDFFDGAPITGPLVIKQDMYNRPTRVWLNIENNMFYNQREISPEKYLLELEKLPEFISSPEIGFLKSIGPKLRNSQTKLFFLIPEETRQEPTTNTPYDMLLKNLPMIKSFASGIVVPKQYIWPGTKDLFLLPPTNLVQEAHKLGLAVYASGFVNDVVLSYNYSSDPVREYMQFVNNPLFSVDGVLSPFPSTASEAIGCLNPDRHSPRQINATIISHNGASGDFPGSTDLAYQKAIDDGADAIDCSVQMTKDGIAFCSQRSDLTKSTTAPVVYMDVLQNIPEIQEADGIFSFDLDWSQIQSLRPQLESPYEAGHVRNPAHKYSGKLMTLAEFLTLAKTKAAPGILVNIQNAAFLATRGLDVVGTVEAALKNATLDKQRILIMSEDRSVLLKFKDKPNYERVLHIKKSISGVPEQVAREVKKYADAVFVHRDSVVPAAPNNLASNITNTVQDLHAANLSVYVGYLKNEFDNFVFDYLSDPYVELCTLTSLQVNGYITDFPATADLFARSTCMRDDSVYKIQRIQPGFFLALPPMPPGPLLSTADVVHPPLPPVAKNSTPPSPSPSTPSSGSPPPPGQKSSSPSDTVSTADLLLAAILALVTIVT